MLLLLGYQELGIWASAPRGGISELCLETQLDVKGARVGERDSDQLREATSWNSGQFPGSSEVGKIVMKTIWIYSGAHSWFLINDVQLTRFSQRQKLNKKLEELTIYFTKASADWYFALRNGIGSGGPKWHYIKWEQPAR